MIASVTENEINAAKLRTQREGQYKNSFHKQKAMVYGFVGEIVFDRLMKGILGQNNSKIVDKYDYDIQLKLKQTTLNLEIKTSKYKQRQTDRLLISANNPTQRAHLYVFLSVQLNSDQTSGFLYFRGAVKTSTFRRSASYIEDDILFPAFSISTQQCHNFPVFLDKLFKIQQSNRRKEQTKKQSMFIKTDSTPAQLALKIFQIND